MEYVKCPTLLSVDVVTLLSFLEVKRNKILKQFCQFEDVLSSVTPICPIDSPSLSPKSVFRVPESLF